MKLITSKENALYKHWVRVGQSKIKNEILLEGTHLCEMWLKHKAQPRHIILRQESSYTDVGLQRILQELDGQEIHVLSDKLFQSLNSVPSPQAILFHVEIESSEQFPPANGNTVYLDRIQDPGNLGTIIRTCAAAGVNALYLSPGTVNVWSPKVIRSAQGAHFSLNIYTQVAAKDFFAQAQLPIYVTHLSNQAKNLYQLDFTERVIWVFGNEGQGVGEEIIRYATEQVYIPQSARVESLNVGVACGVALFEQRRQVMFSRPFFK